MTAATYIRSLSNNTFKTRKEECENQNYVFVVVGNYETNPISSLLISSTKWLN
jgi:hypothetical protein